MLWFEAETKFKGVPENSTLNSIGKFTKLYYKSNSKSSREMSKSKKSLNWGLSRDTFLALSKDPSKYNFSIHHYL